MLASPAITPRPQPLRGRLPSLAAAAGFAVHVLVAVWVFAPALWGGRTLYFRDISTYFYPNLVFLERSLEGGVFPLWNPAVDGGAPFLMIYPVDVLLVALGGAGIALAAGPPLHMLLASTGASALGRELGMSRLAAATCGLVFALSGFMVSAVNLMEKHQAAAWAPLVLLATLRCARRPGPAQAALLAVAAALQLSTLAGEIVLQTAAAAAVLISWRSIDRHVLSALAGAGFLAALLSAPALLGAAAVMKDTRRGSGFGAAEALSGSASPLELAGILLPRFFGDMHTFSDAGFWGQDVFPGGFPYLLSLYLGVAALALAAAAGRDRLWLMVGAAILLALGAHGPFAPVLASLVVFRAPVKFLFLASLGVALLVGRGLDRARRSRAQWLTLAPGVALTLVAIGLHAAPERTLAALTIFPALADPATQAVIRAAWPAAFLLSGVLALAVGAAATHGGRIAAAAGVVVVLDLLAVNGDVNRFAPAVFYELRPEVRALLAPVFRGEPARVFGYGIGNTPGLPVAPSLLRENADVWLYYLDRQVLWGRAAVLDGLETAFDEDRTAWAPPGASLSAAESRPDAFDSVHARLRLANVRWILSFAPLPVALVSERGTAQLPEVLVPLRLYEMREPLPRAFFASDPGAPEAGPAPPVEVVAQGPHEVRLRARTPPGYVVLLAGWNPGWRAWSGDGAEVEVVRAGPRYTALATPGGEQAFHLRYRPRWWPRALALLALGAMATLAALGWSLRSRPPGGAATPGDRS
jgi:hypothetical protein